MSDFAWALKQLKAGQHVTRKAWNGTHQLYREQGQISIISTSSYNASSTDIMATDWQDVNEAPTAQEPSNAN